MAWREEAKKRAASEAVKHAKNGNIIGLGSGSTAAYAIERLGQKIRQEKIRILGVPTSYQALMLAARCNIPITSLDEHPQLALAIDGADQVDSKLNLIKGMGGALAREKIVASAATRFMVVADETKLVEKLGKNQVVPVEVLPFALSPTIKTLQQMGGKPVVREGKGKVGPLVTDNGNFIVDVDFGTIDAPRELNSQLKLLPGVVETGLFIEMAHTVYLGTRKAVAELRRE